MARILVIDDEQIILNLARRALEAAGHEVSTAENGRVGSRLCRQDPPDLVISDILMPEMDGIELLQELRKDFPDLHIIAMSGGGVFRNLSTLTTAKHLGAVRTISKPFAMPELVALANEILDADAEGQA